MQTFSSMQRNSCDIRVIKSIIFFVFILFYQIISSMYATVPPLIGLFFAYAVVLNYEKNKNHVDYNHEWYQAIIYLFLAEQIHGFELFSIAIFFWLFYCIAFEYSLENIRLRNMFLVFLTVNGYLGTFLVSNLISYLKDGAYIYFEPEYATYMIIESAFAILFLKGRIL